MTNQSKALWNQKRFIVLLSVAIFCLVICGIIAPVFFHFIQQRPGILLSDSILSFLPAYNLSAVIFSILYLFITFSIAYLIIHPSCLLLGLYAYLFLTIFRCITLLLVPLDQPSGLIELRDPVVDYFFYQESITKDLFFSGHTSIIFLLAFIIPHPIIQKILFGIGLLIGLMLLIQHAHYFIDVIAAPFFAWIAFILAKFFLKSLGYSYV